MSSQKSGKRWIFALILVVVLVVASLGGIYAYNVNRQQEAAKSVTMSIRGLDVDGTGRVFLSVKYENPSVYNVQVVGGEIHLTIGGYYLGSQVIERSFNLSPGQTLIRTYEYPISLAFGLQLSALKLSAEKVDVRVNGYYRVKCGDQLTTTQFDKTLAWP